MIDVKDGACKSNRHTNLEKKLELENSIKCKYEITNKKFAHYA